MKLLIFILLIIASPIYPFSYDSAIYKAQKGNWQDAHVALNSIITHNPDNADVMYDAGVAAYNLGNKQQAATCFSRAAECSGDKNICFRSHFNAGNVCVEEKKLEDALAEYDKALEIEPDNEYARHNRDRVAEMLKKEQEQKNQDDQKKDQQNNQDKNDDQKQDKQDNQDQCGCDNQKQNQENKDQQNQNQSGNKQQQNQQGNEQEKNGAEKKLDQQAQQDQGSDAADGGDNAQRKEQGNNKKEQHKNSGNYEKRDGQQELDKKAQGAQKERNKQQGEKHGTSPEKQNVSENASDDKINVPADDGQEQLIDDPWLLNVLQNQEIHDKAINKQLMGAKIRQHGGKNGQNCW